MVRRGMVVAAFVATLVAVSCVSSKTKLCGDFVCATNDVCTPDGNRCASPLALDACQAKNEGDACSYPGTPAGVCSAGVCELSGCGNGVVEPMSDEICDDSNRISGDGCSADCRSTEVCGDGIVDAAQRESCDCGLDPANLPVGCNGVNSQEPDATCRLDCSQGRCGDGVIDRPNEQCDDGNTIAGDGCAADCSGRWTRMASNTFIRLRSVWAASPTDAWTVGDDRILHWDGAQWNRVTPPSAGLVWSDVCGVSASQILFIGGAASPLQVFRYDTGTGVWSDVTPDATVDWHGLFCRGANAWISGAPSDTSKSAYAVWDGTSFTSHLVDVDLGFNTIWSSTDNILFAGRGNALYRADATATTWQPEALTASSGHMAGTTSSDVFVTRNAVAAHYDGVWATIPSSNEVQSPKGISLIPGATPSETIMAGGSGTVVTCTAALCTPSPTPVGVDFSGAFALDRNHAFVVGDLGTILF